MDAISRDRSDTLFSTFTAGASPAERARARAELLELHLPLVEHCAWPFRHRGEPLEDLVQVGTIGLIKAVDRFDPARGAAFSTYATPTIIGEIKRHFRDRGWAIRVPRRLQELRMSIPGATAELAQRLGRSPTPAEVAELLDVDVELVVEGIESTHAYATLSLDHVGSLLETLGVVDEALHDVELRASIRPLIEELTERERRILVLRFFRQLTQSEIAAEVGISQMHVSRLLARTLAELREAIA
ncbi:MAG TPA: SigB/SigF/SigG family RNA polymerase sigma factor [Marmoricola sp.]